MREIVRGRENERVCEKGGDLESGIFDPIKTDFKVLKSSIERVKVLKCFVVLAPTKLG